MAERRVDGVRSAWKSSSSSSSVLLDTMSRSLSDRESIGFSLSIFFFDSPPVKARSLKGMKMGDERSSGCDDTDTLLMVRCGEGGGGACVSAGGSHGGSDMDTSSGGVESNKGEMGEDAEEREEEEEGEGPGGRKWGVVAAPEEVLSGEAGGMPSSLGSLEEGMEYGRIFLGKPFAGKEEPRIRS